MKSKNNIYLITTSALMAALICIFGPMSVPIGPIPVSLTNLILYFAIYIIGTKGTTISFLVYLLIGLVGLPVFSGFSGGVAKLAGPTGGYLIGFIPMILIMGYVHKKTNANVWLTGLAMIVGTVVCYLFGTAWFVFVMKCDFVYALSVCVFPFIPFDLLKIVIATILGKSVHTALKKANLVK